MVPGRQVGSPLPQLCSSLVAFLLFLPFDSPAPASGALVASPAGAALQPGVLQFTHSLPQVFAQMFTFSAWPFPTTLFKFKTVPTPS